MGNGDTSACFHQLMTQRPAGADETNMDNESAACFDATVPAIRQMVRKSMRDVVGAGREQFVACSYEPVREVRRVVCSTTVQIVVLPPGLEMLLVGGAWWVESHVTTFDERAVV
eukprot:COSAG06_NODE_4771_length_3966_cov_2.491337_8_plen_113_part_01